MLKTVSLHKKYNDFTALKSLNLEIEKGEIFALLGQNGAGKSTTINILLGLIKPTAGDAYIDQISIKENPQKIKKHLAYIPETVLLYPNLTGLENLDFSPRLPGLIIQKKNYHHC